MRIVLVGSAPDRARLRAALAGAAIERAAPAAAAIEVIGEAPTLAAARAAGFDADAYLIASDEEEGAAAAAAAPPPEPLTPREIEVLELLAEGLPNKAIAARLDISDQTVKSHVASICGKLGAANRTDAVRRAVRRGLVTL
jgi:DNA-binding NarL/FixJ family response regulator